MVEVARLESVYRFIAYPGFESPSLRQDKKNKPPSGGFFLAWRREAGRLRGLRRGFEGRALTSASRSESPNCHRASGGAARCGRALIPLANIFPTATVKPSYREQTGGPSSIAVPVKLVIASRDT